MSETSFKYNPAIDGLRAGAVIAVILFHAFVPVLPGGFLGVDVFFVISGFLITSLLIDEQERTGRVDFRAFYNRRLRRLMPALGCLVLLYLAIGPLLWPQAGFEAHLRDGLTALFYVSDFTVTAGGIPKYLKHTWSLAVEMQYYLIWPVIFIKFLKKTSAPQALKHLVVFYVALTLWRWISAFIFGWDLTYFRPDARLSGLVLGGILAFVISTGRRFQQAEICAVLLVALSAGIWALASWGSFLALSVGCTAIEIATFFVILQTSQSERSAMTAALSHPVLRYLGRISYGLYLYHYPVIFYLRNLMAWPQAAALGFAVTCILAAVSFETVEKFFLPVRPKGNASCS